MSVIYKGFGLVLLLLLTNTASADPVRSNREYSKSIKKEFNINTNGTTSISNKYGKVDVRTWSQNRVKIDVNIIVDAASEERAQQVFDRIQINFDNVPDAVRAETSIQPQQSKWYLLGGGEEYKSDYTINYQVYLPASNNLEIDHKYGDLYVAGMQGKVSLDIKYVNFKIEDMGDDSSLDFYYGNGSVGNVGDLMANIGHSNLNIEEAADLQLESKYSQVTIGKANDVRVDSKYDNYELAQIRDFRNVGKYDNFRLGLADNVEISTKYTQLTARKVSSTVDLDMEYGTAEVGLQARFEQVNCNGKGTDFRIQPESGARFALDAEATYAGIRYPRQLQVTFEQERPTSHEVRGYVGSSSGDVPLIRCRLNYGALKIER